MKTQQELKTADSNYRTAVVNLEQARHEWLEFIDHSISEVQNSDF